MSDLPDIEDITMSDFEYKCADVYIKREEKKEAKEDDDFEYLSSILMEMGVPASEIERVDHGGACVLNVELSLGDNCAIFRRTGKMCYGLGDLWAAHLENTSDLDNETEEQRTQIFEDYREDLNKIIDDMAVGDQIDAQIMMLFQIAKQLAKLNLLVALNWRH